MTREAAGRFGGRESGRLAPTPVSVGCIGRVPVTPPTSPAKRPNSCTGSRAVLPALALAELMPARRAGVTRTKLFELKEVSTDFFDEHDGVA